jgi:SPP1 family predicted phage head-tail adaptor
MLDAGRLRHRVVVQVPIYSQDPNTGDAVPTWTDLVTVWAAIEPVSVRGFQTSLQSLDAQAEQSKVVASIIMRYRDDINASMRLYHAATNRYFDIQTILPDIQSGLEYMTLPCSQGVRYE